jgi:hypothetical protein
MLTAIYAARNITGERNDVWSVNTEMEYHEEARPGKAAAGDRMIPARVAVNAPAPGENLPDELIAAAFARLDPLAMGISVGAVVGLGLFLAMALFLLKEGEQVGPMLGLLWNYLPGFSLTWAGAFVGMADAGIFGFLLGYFSALLRNWGLGAYAALLKRHADAESLRQLLDKIR